MPRVAQRCMPKTPGCGHSGSGKCAESTSTASTCLKSIRLSGYKGNDAEKAELVMQGQRAMGPKNRPRVERTDTLWSGQHRIGNWEATQGCDRCGRTSCKGKRQARLKQWRPRCIPLKIHERRLMRGHELAGQGQGQCRTCAISTHRLPKTLCTWRRRHPTNGRRLRGKQPLPQ